MTQKEHKEIVDELEKQIRELKKELDLEKNKSYNYEQVLEDYHRISEDLRVEKEWNRQNVASIERLNATIERYERILDKFTINYQ